MGILKISSEYFCEMSQLNETQSYTLGTYTTCKPEISLKGPWPEESKQSRSTARGNLRTIRITVAILASVTVIVGTTFGIIQSTKKPVVQPATTVHTTTTQPTTTASSCEYSAMSCIVVFTVYKLRFSCTTDNGN